MHDVTSMSNEEGNLNHSFNDPAPSLVAFAKAGDAEAFDVLASTYRKKILNTIRRITGNIDDAEDLTQEALIKAFLNLRAFRETCSFSTWLTRIAINEALMWKRKPQKRFEVSWPNPAGIEEFGIVPEVADMRPNPEQCYDNQEQHRIAESAIKKLRSAPRLAFEMCALNECSLKELAQLQNISVSAAKSRLFRSRKLIQSRVMRFLQPRTSQRTRPIVQPA